MAIPKINGSDLWSLAVDKINNAIDRITASFTRTGKTLKIVAEDGASVTVDLSASPDTVINGVDVSQQGADQRKFDITGGAVRIAEDEISVGVQTVAVADGDPVNPRLDALAINAGGVLTVQAGTPAAVPLAPSKVAGTVQVAFIWVEANADATTNNIYFKPILEDANGIYQKEGGTFTQIIGGVEQGAAPVKADQTETNTGTDDNKYITPLKLANNTSQRATQPEVDAGANNTKFVTPLTLATKPKGITYSESFSTLTLTTNNSWHTVIVPGAPVNKVIQVVMENTNIANRFVGVREVGSVNDRRLDVSSETSLTMIVKTNASGEVEVYSENRTQTNHYLTAILDVL